jgi:glycosyltransferase involved in cell wall biosynthesis
MITIIIPTYRPQEYFYECLCSIKQQNITCNYEVIIVLNGEKHPYYEEIKEWIKQLDLSDCRLTHTDIKGVSNARNMALDIAKGDYVTFIDDDDKVSSNYLVSLLELINNNDNTVVLSNSLSFTKNKNRIRNHLSIVHDACIKKKKITLLSSRSFFSVVWAKLIPLNIIQHRRFNINFANGEDALFMALISDKIKSIRFANRDVIYYRRIRENSASQRKRSFFSKLKNVINLFLAYCKIYISSLLKYNILFFITRLMAVLRNIKKESF